LKKIGFLKKNLSLNWKHKFGCILEERPELTSILRDFRDILSSLFRIFWIFTVNFGKRETQLGGVKWEYDGDCSPSFQLCVNIRAVAAPGTRKAIKSNIQMSLKSCDMKLFIPYSHAISYLCSFHLSVCDPIVFACPIFQRWLLFFWVLPKFFIYCFLFY